MDILIKFCNLVFSFGLFNFKGRFICLSKPVGWFLSHWFYFSLPGGVNAQQPCNNVLPQFGNVGINLESSSTPVKPIHISGNIVCPDPAIRLEYLGTEVGQIFGHLALKTPFNELYSFQAVTGDIILQSDFKANDIILTTRNKGKKIRFSTMGDIQAGNPGGWDYERFRISTELCHTLVDIKVPAFTPIDPNYPNELPARKALLRFQITDDFGLPLGGEGHPGYNWKMGIDTWGHGWNINVFKIGAQQINDINDPINTSFDNLNTAITIKTNNSLIFGNPKDYFVHLYGGSDSKVFIVSDDDTNKTALYVYKKGFPLGYGIIDYIFTNGSSNVAQEVKALTVANDLSPSAWKEVFTVWGDGTTYIDGQVVISDGLNGFKRQQNHLDARLFVNGTIVAKEMYITIDNWSDFVFDNNYKLPNLLELEEAIQREGHLPGIPSAQEVAEKGVNIAEMQAKLLQKIEELTLYLIELKKENENLKEKIKILENK